MAGNLSKRPNNDAEAGKDGVGISRAYVQDGNLYVVLTDNRTLLAGYVKGPVPQKGVDYLTEEEVNRIKNEIAPIRGVHYWTEEDKEEVISAASPMRGVDYWTEADKQGMKEDIEATHAHYGVPATGVLLEEKTYENTIYAEEWQLLANDFIESVAGISNPEICEYPYFKVVWNGKAYQVKNYEDDEVNIGFTDTETNTEVSIMITSVSDETYSLRVSQYNPGGVSAEVVPFSLTPATGVYESIIKQLDPIFIPDYVSKTYVDSTITHRCIPKYGEKTVFDLSDAWESNEGEYMTNTVEYVPFETGKQYAVNWHGKTYICTAKEEYFAEQDYYVYSINNGEIEYGKEGYFSFAWTPKYNVFDIHYWGHTESCEIMPYSEIVEQLDPKFIPDYVSKAYVDKNRPCYSIPADGELLIEKKFSHTIPANDWVIVDEDGDISKYGIEAVESSYTYLEVVDYEYFKVIWNGTEYNVSDSDVSGKIALYLEDTNMGNHVQIFVGENAPGVYEVLVALPYAKSLPTEPITLEIIPYTGSYEEEIKQLETKYIPDYISKTEVNEMVGDIDTALDSIIAMQNKLIGGDAE